MSYYEIYGPLLYNVLHWMIRHVQHDILQLPNGDEIIDQIINVWHLFNSQIIPIELMQNMPNIFEGLLTVLAQISLTLPSQVAMEILEWLEAIFQS